VFHKKRKKKGKNFERKLIFLFILPPRPLKKTAASSSHTKNVCSSRQKRGRGEDSDLFQHTPPK